MSSCTRCVKSCLPCSWPEPEKTLHDQRHGRGSWKERARKGTLALPQLLPEISSIPVAVASRSSREQDVPNNTLPVTVGSDLDPVPGFDASWAGYDNVEEELQRASNLENDFLPVVDPSCEAFPNRAGFELLSIPDNVQQYFFAQRGASSPALPFTPSNSSFISAPWASYLPELPFVPSPSSYLSGHSIPLPNSLKLSEKDHHALGHYQTAFSIYRTTKDPKWSTHKLLLDLGAKSTMIMRFILAVAINDVCHRQEHEASMEAQEHFEIGAQELIKMIKRNSEADCLLAMAGFLFLYW